MTIKIAAFRESKTLEQHLEKNYILFLWLRKIFCQKAKEMIEMAFRIQKIQKYWSLKGLKVLDLELLSSWAHQLAKGVIVGSDPLSCMQ